MDIQRLTESQMKYDMWKRSMLEKGSEDKKELRFAQFFGPLGLQKYQEESVDLAELKDISTLMLKRIEAGYHVDTIEFNSRLVNKFTDAQGLY